MEQGSRKFISEIKKFYEELLKSDDLENIYPKAIVNWKDDKDNFIKYYIETIELENEIERDPLITLEPSHLRDFKDELGLED